MTARIISSNQLSDSPIIRRTFIKALKPTQQVNYSLKDEPTMNSTRSDLRLGSGTGGPNPPLYWVGFGSKYPTIEIIIKNIIFLPIYNVDEQGNLFLSNSLGNQTI